MPHYRKINKLSVVLLIVRRLLRAAFVRQMHPVVIRSAELCTVCIFFVCIRRNEYPNGAFMFQSNTGDGSVCLAVLPLTNPSVKWRVVGISKLFFPLYGVLYVFIKYVSGV